jgi:transposase
MRKTTEVLRLRAAGLSVRDIARSTGAGRTTVFEYLVRADAAGVSWPLPEGMGAEEVEAALFPRSAPSWR